ncbi:phospholipase D-like domain-containing protein [Acidithiobacillus thiooxidans]|uniref:phospholipase D-like domain-containing protein n=1 Tax=Acidithiobacillus thiooxidans TaxID=930 RepID=UPI0009DB2B8F|nr:phospholipase D-like domain-containing protein [Acidithiobacillus thiooxidans]
MSLFIEPNAGVSPILQVIQSARHELNVGVYYMTDRPILRAIRAAKARGVVVRVIIEGKPYGMKSWQVRKEEREIKATGAALHLAPYRFTSHGEDWAFYHALCHLYVALRAISIFIKQSDKTASNRFSVAFGIFSYKAFIFPK